MADTVANQILDLVEVVDCTLRCLVEIRFPPSTLPKKIFVLLVKLSFDVDCDHESLDSQLIGVD